MSDEIPIGPGNPTGGYGLNDLRSLPSSTGYTCPEHEAMKLPLGKTCDDCRHSKRCFALGYSETGRTSCDFYPSKYRGRDNCC